MRLLAINPGASIATIDVHNGYVAALKRQGHEVYEYALDRRIDRSGAWLTWNWRQARRETPDIERPNAADILYWAGTHAIEMALRIEPDWVIVMSGMYFLKDTMLLLRKAVKPWARMALVLTESPYDDAAQEQVAPLFDLVTTNERTSLPRLRMANPNTVYLGHAFDPDKHHPDAPIDDDTPSHDVLFVGTGFQERLDLLSAVDWTGIDLALYGTYSLLGSRSKLRQYIRGGYVSNERAGMLYRRARVNLNLYRESMGFGRDAPRISAAESLNPRALELASLGAFQISSERAEVDEVFDRTLPQFMTTAELQEQIHYWLSKPQIARDSIAMHQRQLVQPHTYDARAAQLTEVLSSARRAA